MHEFIYLIPIAIAFFLAFNMGASGTSPSFSAAYGANLIKRESIPGLFGLFVLFGALMAGHKVMATIGGAILPSAQMSFVVVSIILLSSALSLLFANILKVPQSTSQSTIFALAGCALSFGSLQTRKLFLEIVPLWFVLPLVAFVLTALLATLVRRFKSTQLAVSFANLSPRGYWKAVTIACSCYVAFSIGSNNVANAAGPISSLLRNEIGINDEVSALMLSLICILLVAPWFGIGGSMLGGRVLSTTGKDMVEIGPSSAALVSVVTASLLLFASLTRGIPASLVQMNTFAIMAIGYVNRDRANIKKSVVLKLWVIWLAAPVIAFVIAFTLTTISAWTGLI